MKKVVAFGEIMLRLAPEGYHRFLQAQTFEVAFGGSEANVAMSLANYGVNAAFVTKLPEHEIGQAAINKLRQYGVNTSEIVRGGRRIGVYYLEKGAAQRPSKVIYDRVGSAIAAAGREEFDWEKILSDADWFHFTGITPALSKNVAKLCMDACKAAKAKGIPVSCDLNYRQNLWTREQARSVMTALAPYIDVCIANEEDAKDVFGIEAADSDIGYGRLSYAGYRDVAKQLTERFGFSRVAITLRVSLSASDNEWSAMLCEGGEYCFSSKYQIHIVDRVGAGDSFAAGLIYGLINGFGAQNAIDFAAAASCLKHSIEGDFNMVSVEEVEKLIAGDSSGRVQR